MAVLMHFSFVFCMMVVIRVNSLEVGGLSLTPKVALADAMTSDVSTAYFCCGLFFPFEP
jgi:hypothetical protein